MHDIVKGFATDGPKRKSLEIVKAKLRETDVRHSQFRILNYYITTSAPFVLRV